MPNSTAALDSPRHQPLGDPHVRAADTHVLPMGRRPSNDTKRLGAPSGVGVGAVGASAHASEDKASGFAAIAAAFESATAATVAAGRSVADGEVLSEPLVRAVLRFLVVFDALGSAVIGKLVGADFRNKTEAVRRAAKRERTSTVSALVAAEQRRPPSWLDANATEALLWTKRVLGFVDALVAHLLDGDELRAAATNAYRKTLGVKHHALTRTVFENALNLLPDRRTFVRNLYNVDEPSDEQLAHTVATMHAFRTACKPHIIGLDKVFPDE